jgi:nicotinamide-nucleotide amidase
MTVDVEILCIGNELLIGKVLNTNAHWLAGQTTSLGANVRRITVIQDTVEEIVGTIKEVAARKPHFLITTGGLGPTFDDKTMQALAVALNQKFTVNPAALEMVKERCVAYFKKRGMPTEVEMTPPRVKMATLPENTEVVVNPIGTAPSIRAQIGGTVLFVLPGVPMEVEAIFTESIAPLIKQAGGSAVFCQKSIFADIGESRLAPLIDIVMADNVGVYIKSHPIRSEGNPHVELHLTITECAEHKPSKAVEKAARELAALIEANGGAIKSPE